MIHQDISLYLMETLTYWISLHGYIVVLMLLSTFNTGSTCEAPSSPLCFRRNAEDTFYCCEWNMNTTEHDVTYNLYIGEKKFANIKKTSHEIIEEQIISRRPVITWVEAYAGNSSCTSTRKSVELQHTVKYEAPQNITMTWSKNNLHLNWKPVDKHPALAEVRYRRDQYPSESWETKLTNTTKDKMKYQSIIVNLLRHTAYQVQVRHRSVQALNPQWSDWSPMVIFPAELDQKPQVSITTSLMNGTRKVTLTWKPVPHAAAVSGVTYSIRDTQSSRSCPCKMKEHRLKSKTHTFFVSFSAVNISVTARNAAGYSPPSITQVLPVTAAGLKTCSETLLGKKLKGKTCLELFEMQDGDSMPKNIITLTKRKDINETLKDYVRYLYFEHRCNRGKPQTVKMCLFYHKEGVPNREPQDLSPSGETQCSVNLSWKPIPSESQRGFLSHYSLCSTKISSKDEPKECRNISASVIKHSLENLTPGAKYKISLAGVTLKGEGPKATIAINTLPENSVNVLPWSLSSLFVFFLLLTVCTCVLTRNKNKFFPPVPTPVIPNFTHYEPESQKMLERKEEVDKLTLHQLHPDGKSAPEGAEETTVVGGLWNDDTDGDIENERGDSSGGASDEHFSPSPTDPTLRSSTEAEMADLEKVDNEIAMLIYRNGLVFDVKTDSA